jgi:SLT domain-containing protein
VGHRGVLGGGIGAWNAWHHWDEDKNDDDALIGQAGGGGIRAPKRAGQPQQGGEADPRAAQAAAAATSVLGLPYKWGGTNPKKGLDCSGLTQYAYQQAGVTLPRTTYEQIKVGHAVSGAYQAGDLLFPNSGHVMMAISPTEAMEEPHTGAVARRVPIPKNLLAARRVFGAAGGDAAGTPQAAGAPAGAGTAATGSQQSKTGSTPGAGAGMLNASGMLGALSTLIGDKYGNANELATLTAMFSDTSLTANTLTTMLGAATATTGAGTNTNSSNGNAAGNTPAATPQTNAKTNASNSTKASGTVDGWIRDAMKRTNTDPKFFDVIKKRVMIESGGNPTIVNTTDSNAKAGHPSRGAMQLIPSNFATYRDPSLPDDINDPVANITAGINYVNARYKNKGTWNEIARRNSKGIGYASGSWQIPRDQYALIHQGEMVIPRIQAEALRKAQQGDGQGPWPKATAKTGAAGGVTLNFNPGAIVIQGGGAMDSTGAVTFGKRIVDAIAADQRLQKLGAGL